MVRGQRRCFVLKMRARGCETKVLRGVSVPPRSRGADQQVRLDMTATGHAAFSRTQGVWKKRGMPPPNGACVSACGWDVATHQSHGIINTGLPCLLLQTNDLRDVLVRVRASRRWRRRG